MPRGRERQIHRVRARRREDERKEERERETVIAEAQFIYGPSQKLAMTIEPMLSAPED